MADWLFYVAFTIGGVAFGWFWGREPYAAEGKQVYIAKVPRSEFEALERLVNGATRFEFDGIDIEKTTAR